jgi:hypothetical protein
MEAVINAIRIAIPFAEIAYAAALLINPRAAQEIRIGIDAFKRALENPDGGIVIARGYEAIEAKGREVIGALNTIVSSGLSVTERRRQAEEVASILSDPTKVQQARKGKDAELLASLKNQAAKIVKSIS